MKNETNEEETRESGDQCKFGLFRVPVNRNKINAIAFLFTCSSCFLFRRFLRSISIIKQLLFIARLNF